MIDIPTKSILSRILQQPILQTLRTHQSTMAEETGIVVIPMQALRAMSADLDHRSMVLIATLDLRLQIPAADPVHPHLRIQAPHPVPVRLLDQVPPGLPHPIPLLRVQTLHRTQATTHRPDQATVRRLH
ncbi:MAG TPA: hypothetical protein VGK21_04220, partial [Candidatus Angelobacter sp.]